MTVAVNDTIERYTITGAGPYPYTWRIFNDTDLQVYALSTASPPVPTLLTYLTHYTVTGANVSSGGSITLTAAAIAAFTGYTLDIRANTPRNQPTSIRNIARFLPEIHEDAYDDLERQIQDLGRLVDASVRSPDNELPLAMILPPVASRAGGYLAFDVAGLPIRSAGTGNDSALRTDLASGVSGSDGSRLVNFKSVLANAIARSLFTKLSDCVSVKDFGAVGDGVTDDTTAFQNAINSGALRIHLPMPSVAYRITASLAMPTNRSINIQGDGWGWTLGGAFVAGCNIDFDCATANAALFNWAGFVQGVLFHGISIRLKQASKNQRAWAFAAVLQGSIRQCRIEGTSTALDTNTAIEFKNAALIGSAFSGAFEVSGCYFTNCQKAVTWAANCTSFRFVNNEVYGNNPASASLIGLSMATNTVGIIVENNYFQGWATTAIDDDGSSNSLVSNRFENNTISYDRSGASLPVGIGNTIVSGGNPLFPATAQATIDIRPRNFQVDDTAPSFGLGYVERYRGVKLGDWTTYVAVFTGSGTLTFTAVTSTTIRYRLVGNTMQVQWLLSGTIGGAGAELRISLPAGATAVGRCRNVVFNFESAAQKFGVAEVQNGDAFIRVFKDSAVSGNWGAGAGETYGDIEFLVSGV